MEQERTPLLGHARTAGETASDATPITVIYSWWGTAALTLLLLLGGVTQSVSIPLWLTSFGNTLGGPYVIVLLSSAFYVILFGPLCLALRLLPSHPVRCPSFRKYFPQYVLIGLFDCANGLLSVYTANPNRLSPVLSAILGNLTIIFAMVFTPIVIKAKRNLSYVHVLPILGVSAVVCGTVISLIPEFLALAEHKERFAGGYDAAIYTVLFIVSLIPGVLYNILQERVLAERSEELEASAATVGPWQPYLDQVSVLFWGCLFQLAFTALAFWVDLVPHFGYSRDMHELLRGLASATRCVFGGEHCSPRALWLGILFNAGYAVSYLASIALNRESTNYATISSTMAAPLTAAFFLIFPAVLPSGSHNPPLWSVLPALLLAVLGTLAWKLWENNSAAAIIDRVRSALSRRPGFAVMSTNADLIE